MKVVLKCCQKNIVFAYWNIYIYFNDKYYILEVSSYVISKHYKIAFKLDFISCCEKFHLFIFHGYLAYRQDEKV